MPRSGKLFAALFTCLSLIGCVTLQPTFDRASVRLPVNVLGAYADEINAANFAAEDLARTLRKRPQYPASPIALLAGKVPTGVKLPVIVYLHGCGGILRASIGHLRWLATLDDFVVIAPNSFARERAEYCYRNFTINLLIRKEVSAMRMNEMHLALDQIVKLPWVDRDNIFLIGHSQGGGMVAGYSGNVKIRGRILLNGGCFDIFGENMNDDEALLTFDTGKDPWFRNSRSQCRDYVLRHPGGKSVWEPGGITHDLVTSHWPMVKAFLTDNRH
jgi:dienelactone hydrolase